MTIANKIHYSMDIFLLHVLAWALYSRLEIEKCKQKWKNSREEDKVGYIFQKIKQKDKEIENRKKVKLERESKSLHLTNRNSEKKWRLRS